MKFDRILQGNCDRPTTTTTTTTVSTTAATTGATTGATTAATTSATTAAPGTTTTVAPPSALPEYLTFFCLDDNPVAFSPFVGNQTITHLPCNDSTWNGQSFLHNETAATHHSQLQEYHATSVSISNAMTFDQFKAAVMVLRWTTSTRIAASQPCFEVTTSLGAELSDQELIDSFVEDAKTRLEFSSGGAAGFNGIAVKLGDDGTYQLHVRKPAANTTPAPSADINLTVVRNYDTGFFTGVCASSTWFGQPIYSGSASFGIRTFDEVKTSSLTFYWNTVARQAAGQPCFEVTTTVGAHLNDTQIQATWPDFTLTLNVDGTYTIT